MPATTSAQRRLDRVEQRVLQQQVLDRVAGQRQLREDGQRRRPRRGTRRAVREHGRGVGRGVGDDGAQGGGGDAQEAVPVERSGSPASGMAETAVPSGRRARGPSLPESRPRVRERWRTRPRPRPGTATSCPECGDSRAGSVGLAQRLRRLANVRPGGSARRGRTDPRGATPGRWHAGDRAPPSLDHSACSSPRRSPSPRPAMRPTPPRRPRPPTAAPDHGPGERRRRAARARAVLRADALVGAVRAVRRPGRPDRLRRQPLRLHPVEVPLDYAKPDGRTAQLGVLRKGDRRQDRVARDQPGRPRRVGHERRAVAVRHGRRSRRPAREAVRRHRPRPARRRRQHARRSTASPTPSGRSSAATSTSTPPRPASRPDRGRRTGSTRSAARSGSARTCSPTSAPATPPATSTSCAPRSATRSSPTSATPTAPGSGSTYAEDFPQNVRALVLDGALDPSQSTVDRSVAQAAGFQQRLRRVRRRVRQAARTARSARTRPGDRRGSRRSPGR